MLVHESRHVRRFLLRIEPGEDVVASLARLARSELHRAGWVRGRGIVEWAELAAFDGEARSHRAARRVPGPLSIVLEGALAMRLGEPSFDIEATAGREVQGDTVRAMPAFGGRLVAASAIAVECVLEVFEDLRLERQDDDALGVPIWRTGERVPGVLARARAGAELAAPPTPPGSPAPASPRTPDAVAPPSPPVAATAPSGPLSWATVAAVSDATPDEPETREPGRGDWVEHRQFGLCRVEGEDPDGGVRVRLPSGARKTLRLDVMEILPPRREADRTVFPIRPRSR
jgi:predicted DNA-binding protein with PD1-like motif